MEKIEQLTKLNELLKDKVISKEEFDSLKQEALSMKNGSSVEINEKIVKILNERLREFNKNKIKELSKAR